MPPAQATNKIDRSEILNRFPLVTICQDDGMVFKKQGAELYALCPFHADKGRPNFRINLEKQTWFCDVCQSGGSVIDYLARKRNVSPEDVFRQLASEAAHVSAPTGTTQPRVVRTHDYLDQTGDLAFQVVRLEPKSFRQRRKTGDHWVWNMEGVTRILYNLPGLMRGDTQCVWITEGEADADALGKHGIVATTNVGGAGKWIDAYSEVLDGKDIVLCGDNDDPGRRHMQQVFESVGKVAKSVRQVKLPGQFKDIRDALASCKDDQECLALLTRLYQDAPVTAGVALLPVRTIDELEADYRAFLARSKERALRLSSWLPSMEVLRDIFPGELVSIVGDTSVGKTCLLQNLALRCNTLPVLMFELELPGSLTFERFMAAAARKTCHQVELTYKTGGSLPDAKDLCRHITVCSKSKITVAEMDAIIGRSELKTGARPALVLVDYLQLVAGMGTDRYEKVSAIAEDLKIMAKTTDTVVVFASQIRRPSEDRTRVSRSREVGIHQAKDSGSIENSSGVVLGVWPDQNDPTLLWMRVLKNTKGRVGLTVACNFDGSSMLITERAEPKDDTPAQPYDYDPQWR